MNLPTRKRRRTRLEPVRIQISEREILDDLLYPASPGSRERSLRSQRRQRR
jgi:hypothetical protein